VEALAHLQEYIPSLVISDILMPEMDGYELCRKIKTHDGLKSIPVMLLTQLSEPEDIIKGLECGADNFVTKPYDKESLIPRIRYILVNQKLVLHILEKQGHSVGVASDGREALAAVKKQAFDIVLMDVQMPEMDGFEATRRIRKWERELKAQDSKLKAEGDRNLTAFSLQQRSERVPIVAMTAHAMKGDRERCLEAGMDDYTTKPINREQLFETIYKWTTPSVSGT